MKTFLTLPLLALIVPCHAELASKAPTRDAATHEELVAQQRKAASAPQPSLRDATMTPADASVDPSVVNRPGDLFSRSDIFCFNGFATLVPKQAILHIPDSYASRIGLKDGSKFQVWSEFYSSNRGWIVTQEVTRAQAEGREPLSDDIKKALSKCPSVVVATYQSGPISVLPPKAPEPGPDKKQP
ncbi:MAG: hypothetical protein QM755_16390 [Luteolibacter sp.]